MPFVRSPSFIRWLKSMFRGTVIGVMMLTIVSCISSAPNTVRPNSATSHPVKRVDTLQRSGEPETSTRQVALCSGDIQHVPVQEPVGVSLNPPRTEPMIPKWGLGFMQSQWGYDFGFQTQEGFLNHARALRGLDNPYGDHTHPADVMVLDMYWCGGQVEEYSCWDWPNNMRWDNENYPNPKAMIDELHAMNFKIMMNYHRGGFDSHRDEWLKAMQSHFDIGLDAPWLDFWTEGSESEKIIWELMKNHFGEDKRLMWMARHYALPNTENAEGGSFDESGIFQEGIGIETPPNEDNLEKSMPVHWTGDVIGSWLGLEQTIEGIVYSEDGAMGGWSYLHSDTPGHSRVIGPEDAELAVRWIQFSDFTTGTRNHGYTPRAVWSWGETAEEYSYFSRMLRYRLLPYIYTYTNKIWEEAIPLTLPMKFAYPGQADHLKYQYMFGNELLVAPVYKSASELEGQWDVFLPAGEQWVDYWSHKIYNGDQTIQVDVSEANLKHVPLFVKLGSIIPMGPEILYIDTAVHPDPLTLDIYPKCAGVTTFTMHDDDGETLGYQRGEHAKTTFTVEKKAQTIIVNVGESIGEYTGKPSSRDYILKINLVSDAYKTVHLGDSVLRRLSDFQALLGEGGSTDSWAIDKNNHVLYVRFRTSISQANRVVISR